MSHGHDHQHGGTAEFDPDDRNNFTQEFWDERYRSADRLWSGQPNPQLVAQVAGLPPGEALDAGPNCNRCTTAWPRPCARAARC
jgi:hypothetical protein